jgi:demethylmenaquinone methyltransferase/2-methoxy-6-polyprenyl-1,4-benzoquinol methylase
MEAFQKKKENVQNMFDSIAPKYDFLNHLLSFGIDRSWRKKAIKEIPSFDGIILDIATGTADVAIMIAQKHDNQIIGIDISENMLKIGEKKVKDKGLEDQITLIQADSEHLPFIDENFSSIISAFGVRNFENLEKSLLEIHRVLMKNGKIIILEFSRPKVMLFQQIYNFYFHHILPTIGNLISKNKNAYKYLPNSVSNFPCGSEFIKKMEDAGFKQCQYRNLTFGIASIYTGIK